MDPRAGLHRVLACHPNRLDNRTRRALVQDAVDHKEAIVSACGALATWTPADSTGRSPKDTYIVRRHGSKEQIDWDSPNCIPLTPEAFDDLWASALGSLERKQRVYVTDRVIGADPSYALPVQTVSPRAVTSLFALNMFRAVPEAISTSCFSDQPFILLALPYKKVDPNRHRGQLRTLPDGRTSDMAIALDVDRRLGLVYGSAYCGTCKKLMFTAMNYLLPEVGILPLHCSANEGPDGESALLLGLSGTGKTTLSSDPDRALLGDDEHGWSDTGIANFENGCYAKLIDLDPTQEPEIWNATFREAPPGEHGAIIENCMMYPDGTFDVSDNRLTPNSRVSYPMDSLSNIKANPVSGHPRTILFLTADANGVLPPVARLDKARAMLWFLMGYTSKLAGTETGIVDPVSTFSRFFGAPFMPRNPDVYARMLGEKLERHGSRVFLVNTGWTGGPYGVGERMNIGLTRAVVRAAMDGALDDAPCMDDPLFHLEIPLACPGVPTEVLQPRNTWPDPAAYDERARKLAGEFAAHFEKTYGNKNIDPAVADQCPGR